IRDKLVTGVQTCALPIWFSRAGEGTIVGISSVAGERGRRGQPVYCTTKAALNTYLEAIRNRVSQFGVSVVTVKPGPVHTPMTERSEERRVGKEGRASGWE